jgi:pyruvate/2-oxoglutarate dehydrogenase complex dihydrolipoamide dehydrogenase (E3) component
MLETSEVSPVGWRVPVAVGPPDEALVANCRPPDWVNPEPARCYNLVVIGAGTAGLVAAAGAAGVGAKVALIERGRLGGDCLNVGCVPSKALIRAARAAADVRGAGEFGVAVPEGVRVEFGAVMERMRRVRAGISRHDSAARFRDLGVDVFLGAARFTGPGSVAVAGKTLRFRHACIATGSRAAVLPIPGLAEAGYLSNETVFSLTELPRRLAVIGAGPIGCELAQAFARFGAAVTLVEVAPRILIREGEPAAAIVQQSLVADGVHVMTAARIEGVATDGGSKRIRVVVAGRESDVEVDEILVGVGRVPNVERLGLDAAGVEYDRTAGVRVDDFLRTSNPRIYAAGDICSAFKFTHTADAQARIVIRNALFKGRTRNSRLTIPWAIYTDPEIAHVGIDGQEAAARGMRVRVFTEKMDHVDRAILDGETRGFATVWVEARRDRIVGATVVARHAGDLISEIGVAMTGGLGLGTLARTIHPYPTQAEVWQKIGDGYNRSRLSPRLMRVMRRWFAWTR